MNKAKTLKGWDRLSMEIHDWVLDNYERPSQPWELFLGVVEEIGEFLESTNNEKRIDSLGDQVIYALNLQKTAGLNGFMLEEGAPMLRITSERLLLAVARGSRCLLKKSQGIRGYDETRVKSEIGLFLNVWWTWAVRQVNVYDLPTMLEITNQVWEEVSKRNWKEHPETGK